MKPATAKAVQPNTLEDLGRATLQIVHDLKNQLNGLKLYATFLRKRIDRDDRSADERETLAKLIAGLDRAASEMTALVRSAQPVEPQCVEGTDLKRIIFTAIEVSTRDSGPLGQPLATQIEAEQMVGEFDAALLIEAFKAINAEVRNSISTKEINSLSLHVRRDVDMALLEWHGGKLNLRNQPFQSETGCGSVRTALAARIIEAHRGRMACNEGVIRAWLPLSNQRQP
jgi:signal transduction histidine kinase